MRKDDKMLVVGQVLIGFCDGHFGRDSYQDKTVEAVGKDWVVCREKNGIPVFACGDDTFDIHEALADNVDME